MSEAASNHTPHELTVTVGLPCDGADIRIVMQGIVNELAAHYRDAIVPGSVTVYHEGGGVLRWTWETTE
jgi:hypothetical protein